MKKRIGILHISDIHAQEKNKKKLSLLKELLLRDATDLQVLYNTEIKAICITGDLINSGDLSETELDLVLSELIIPLMQGLGLTEDNIFVVPGNHEVRRSQIVEYVESGLASTLASEEAIESFLDSDTSEAMRRIHYFDESFSSQFGGQSVYSDSICHTHILNLENLKIGIACINSSWRSTGIGKAEKGKMVVGQKTIIDSFESIKDTDIKVCLMHHPLDWLVDEDKSAIEKCISCYDIVLNGHIHESDAKMWTSFNGQSLFNTCGKLDDSNDFYNGYALISIEPFSKLCDVILRQYMGFPRNCFDRALHLTESGIFSVSLNAKDDMLALAYTTTHAIEAKFFEFANSFFISNIMSAQTAKGFDESFIEPVFSTHSEYEKETSFDYDETDEVEITIDSLCNSEHNILLLGRKETGKTTILHYIVRHCISRFNYFKTVPILIDCSHVNFAGIDPILRSCVAFVGEYCEDNLSISKQQMVSMLENGLCKILFDNFDTISPANLDKVNAFLSRYPDNKFVFAVTETVSARSIRESPVVPACEHENVYICSLSKKQIRAVAKDVVHQLYAGDETSIVDKIMLCFKKTSLPRTPFVLSLILSLCGDADFTPINEAVVMEQFMESLLEKASPEEIDSKVFDFRVKEDFLIYLVSLMHDKNEYFFTEQEFEEALYTYHQRLGFAVSETRFDMVFFENGALIRTCGHITFRYACMVEYYLEKKAKEDPEFLTHLLTDRNYLNYPNEIQYYTGLNRKDRRILDKLQHELNELFKQLGPLLTELTDYRIELNISIPEDSLSRTIQQSRLSQAQSDEMSDSKDISERRLPETIDKSVTHDEMEAFIQTLLIYGSCIKNLELIELSEKRAAYAGYIQGLHLMLAILKRITQDTLAGFIESLESSPVDDAEKRIRQAKKLVTDILMIALPLSVQNIAVENIGTAKLRAVIEEGISQSTMDSFGCFFGVFTFCDLRLKGLREVLQHYVNGISDKSVLKIVFFKILYYYQFRYFSSSLDSFLENTLADINIKLNKKSKSKKSLYVQQIKERRRKTLPPDIQ